MSVMSPDRETIRRNIFAHGKAVQKSSAATPDDLGERLDRVEMLIEDVGVAKNVLVELDQYVADARGELESIKCIRFLTVAAGFITMLVLLGTFVCVVYFSDTWVMATEPYSRGEFVLATVGGTITILIVLLKGSFRTIGDRHKDDPMPEGIKEAISLVKSIIGK